jgi:hypothetical protein
MQTRIIPIYLNTNENHSQQRQTRSLVAYPYRSGGGSTATGTGRGGPITHPQIFHINFSHPNDYTDCYIKFFAINFLCWFGHGRLSLEVGEDG